MSIMKKIVSMVAAIAIAASTITASFAIDSHDMTAGASSKTVWVCTDDNNIRKSATTSSSILTSVPYGTRLKDLNPLDLTSRWRKVSYGGKTGFMHNKYMAEFDINKTELCVVTSATNVYMDSEKKTVVDKLSLGSAVWMTGDAFRAPDGSWIAPVTYTTTKTYWGFADVIDLGEAFPYLVKIANSTKFYKYETGSEYYKVGAGSYWMIGTSKNRVAIAVKSNGKVVEMWVNRSACQLKEMGVS